MTTFPVRPYTDNSKPDMPSHRLSVIRWKATKEQPKARSALYVSIPQITLLVEPSILKTAMQAALEDLQDSFIRSRIESDIEAGLQLPKSFDISDLEPSSLAAWAEETATSGKLSKEGIQTWFANELREALELRFSELPNMTDDNMSKALAQFQEGLTKLASPQANMPVNIAQQLSKALELANDSKIKLQLGKKLEKFLNPVETSLEFNL